MNQSLGFMPNHSHPIDVRFPFSKYPSDTVEHSAKATYPTIFQTASPTQGRGEPIPGNPGDDVEDAQDTVTHVADNLEMPTTHVSGLGGKTLEVRFEPTTPEVRLPNQATEHYTPFAIQPQDKCLR